LHVVVLVKQVPDIEKVRFDFETGRIDRSSAPAETNPFDLNALEAAVQIKEELGGTVTAISMGPPQAESTLRDAIARGADRAILLTDTRMAGADTLATSYTLACAVKVLGGFDLVICGEKTVDGDTGQVGPEVAEFLGIPHVAYVSEIREVERDRLVVVADMGDKYLVEVRLPALITVTKDVNTPRLPTLRDRLRARKAEIEVWDADVLSKVCDPGRLGFEGSKAIVFRVVVPRREGGGCVFLEGEDAVKRLVDILEERGFLC